MLDALEEEQSRTNHLYLWEPSPLGEEFARGAGSYGKTVFEGSKSI
jgi:hypothetical protein